MARAQPKKKPEEEKAKVTVTCGYRGHQRRRKTLAETLRLVADITAER